MPVMPMFPLGTVLLPSMVLPLHVFEPRYRQLTRDCLEGDRRFGVVLIERGSEVGGGDQRTMVGTVAQMIEVVDLPDGRLALAALGTERIRVARWLDDDPYPRAEVEAWSDPPSSDDLLAPLVEVVALLRRVLAGRAELGDPTPPATIELSDEPVLASYQAVAVSPLGPADRQVLLAAPTAGDRIDRLRELLLEELTVLDQRFAIERDHGRDDHDERDRLDDPDSGGAPDEP